MGKKLHISLSSIAFFCAAENAKASFAGDAIQNLGYAVELSGELTKDPAVSEARRTVGKRIGVVGDVVDIVTAKDKLELAGGLAKSGVSMIAAGLAPSTGGLSVPAGMAINFSIDVISSSYRAHVAHENWMREIDFREQKHADQAKARRDTYFNQWEQSAAAYPNKYKGNLEYAVVGQGQFRPLKEIRKNDEVAEEPERESVNMWQEIRDGQGGECNISINLASWQDYFSDTDAWVSDAVCHQEIGSSSDSDMFQIFDVCENLGSGGVKDGSKVIYRTMVGKVDDERFLVRQHLRSVSSSYDSGYKDWDRYEVARCK